MKLQDLNSEKSYTFANYFKLKSPAEEVADYFGYNLKHQLLELPGSTRKIRGLDELKLRLREHANAFELENERVRREFFIAPVISAILSITNTKLHTEHRVTPQKHLQGIISYYLKRDDNVLIVEGTTPFVKSRRVFASLKTVVTTDRESNLSGALKQLLAQLIALDQNEQTVKPLLYGVVSTGLAWHFMQLNRKDRLLIQDLKVYDVWSELEDIIRTAVGILENEN